MFENLLHIMTDLYRLLPEEMEQLVIDMGYPRYRADQILLPLYYKFPKDLSEIKQLPKDMREKLIEAGYTIGSAKEVHRVVSDIARPICRFSSASLSIPDVIPIVEMVMCR